MLEYGHREPELVKLIKKFPSKKKLWVIPVTSRQLECMPGIRRFTDDLKESFMGDMLDTAYAPGKPIQLMPILNIHKDVKKIKGDLSRSAGEEIMSYLTRLTLYVNGSCQHECNSCYHVYKQFDHCYKSSSNKMELNLSAIENMFRELKGSALSDVRILGGNLFEYSQLEELTTFLDRQSMLKTYYFHVLHLEQGENNLEHLRGQHNVLSVLVPLPVHKSRFGRVWTRMRDSGIKTKWVFIVQHENDLESVQTFSRSYGIGDFLLRPFYNGRNLAFFEKYVFVSREMIQNARPREKDIFSNMVVNPTHFGSLVVLSSGNIHANVNRAPLGKVGYDSLYNVVYKEMSNGNSWRRIRKKVAPCKNCTFELLCPPLSNYEYAIGMNNLCHIRRSEIKS